MTERVTIAPPDERAPVPPCEPTREAHLCQVCGRPGGFGFGGSLLRGRAYRWACLAHRVEVERMGA